MDNNQGRCLKMAHRHIDTHAYALSRGCTHRNGGVLTKHTCLLQSPGKTIFCVYLNHLEMVSALGKTYLTSWGLALQAIKYG